MEKLNTLKYTSCTLAIRLVQGWIFLSAGIRRFFSNPGKLDPNSVEYMAHKLNHAMPGAAFGIDNIVAAVLKHGPFLHFSILVFTTAEFTIGLALILGFFTRFFALCSVGLAVMLMLIFGWLGATCLDEWTMSACNAAMGLVLMIAGGGMLSVDRWADKICPKLGHRSWYQALAGVDLSPQTSYRFGTVFGVIAIVFSVFFYNYLHQGIVGPLHHRTSMTKPHITLSDVQVEGASGSNRNLVFNAYVDAGPDTQGAYVISARLANAAGDPLYSWDGAVLAGLSTEDFANVFKFSLFRPTQYGFVGATGAQGTLHLPLPQSIQLVPQAEYTLILEDIEGTTWQTQWQPSPNNS